MWADIYPPATETDLAPGKARITKVKNWLHEALYGCLPDTPAYIQMNKAATEKVKKYRVSLCAFYDGVSATSDQAANIAPYWTGWGGEDDDDQGVGQGYGGGSDGVGRRRRGVEYGR